MQNNLKNVNINTFIRVRPLMVRESINGKYISVVNPNNGLSNVLTLYEYFNANVIPENITNEDLLNFLKYREHNFTYNYVFHTHSKQNEIFDKIAKPLLTNLLEGYNSCIIAYGQTGTGKTYTMEGNNNEYASKFTNDIEFDTIYKSNIYGVLPLSVIYILDSILNNNDSDINFLIKCSYFQIYNESICDLLKPERTNLKIKEVNNKIYVDNISEWSIRNYSDIFILLNKGQETRKVASTIHNDYSSRSHSIFNLHIEKKVKDTITTSQMTFVDLAGSERLKSESSGNYNTAFNNNNNDKVKLNECKNINKSLSTLSQVFNSIANNNGFVSFRSSKLTRVLENCIQGNCLISIIGTISPGVPSYNETYSTLEFIKRCGKIRKEVYANINKSQKIDSNIEKYLIQIDKLKEELNNKNKDILKLKKIIDSKSYSKNEDYFTEVAKSRELFNKERENKKIIEGQIDNIKSQLLNSSQKNDLSIISKLRQDDNILNLKDNNKIKQIIEKQRDIINALTIKLNEKDMALKQIKEEFEAFEKINYELEISNNHYLNKCNFLEKLLCDNNIKVKKEQIIEIKDNTKTDNPEINNIVKLGDHEIFNITKENLNKAEEKIKKLEQINENKDKELTNLKKYLQSNLSSSNNEDIIICKNEVNKIITLLSNKDCGNQIAKIAKNLISLYNFLNSKYQ